MSDLYRAHAAAMQEDEAAALPFWDLFARSELILALNAESEGDSIDPQVFETSEGAFAVGFTSEAGLAEFSDGIVPYAAIPGRAAAAILGMAGYGLVLDPGEAAILLGPEELVWLTETLATAPEAGEAAIREVLPPGEVATALLEAIGARLAPGLFTALVLARAAADGGAVTPLIAVLGPAPGAEPPLAAALSEALAFAAASDDWQIGFFPAEGPLAAALLRQGMRLDIEEAEPPKPVAPGSDPTKPPKLR